MTSVPRRPLLTLTTLLIVAAATPGTTAARATDPTDRIEGRARLQFDSEVVGWTRSEGGGDATIDNIGLGLARPIGSDRTLASIDNLALLPVGVSVFGLGGGYGIGRRVLLGARIGASFDRTSRPGSDHAYNYFGMVFTPYVEIIPRPRGRALPFILLRSGLSGAILGSRERGEGVDRLSRTSILGPTVGAGGGVHVLLADNFSLDASLVFDQRWYFTRERFADAVTGQETIPSRWDKTWRSFSLGLTLGFSAWF